jgi:hypothetical protein
MNAYYVKIWRKKKRAEARFPTLDFPDPSTDGSLSGYFERTAVQPLPSMRSPTTRPT